MTATITCQPDGWSFSASALARSVSASGGRDCNDAGVVQLERLSFPSLDEPLLIQWRLQQLNDERERDRWIGRAVGAGLALFTGIAVDGFDLGDLASGFMGGAVGDLTVSGLHLLSDRELEDIGLGWSRQPDSLDFHLRRHGRPLHRELLLSLADQQQLLTRCAVRFADGFLAFFSPTPFRSERSDFHGCRRLSGDGAMPEPGHTPATVTSLPCSDGRRRPVQALLTDKGPLLAMQVPRPHHSIY
ncbi:MAG: hypothetical protein VKI83_02700 [Synechococcaceae cyanobacterium]|nr:hypothetical protein [Synechococcaceae cyanobacterium]